MKKYEALEYLLKSEGRLFPEERDELQDVLGRVKDLRRALDAVCQDADKLISALSHDLS